MKIKTFVNQSRRDFLAIFICEHCGHEEEKSGYDDVYFHRSVVPQMECSKCGKRAGKDYRPLTTKYPDEMQV